jgi:hypothetical protein
MMMWDKYPEMIYRAYRELGPSAGSLIRSDVSECSHRSSPGEGMMFVVRNV